MYNYLMCAQVRTYRLHHRSQMQRRFTHKHTITMDDNSYVRSHTLQSPAILSPPLLPFPVPPLWDHRMVCTWNMIIRRCWSVYLSIRTRHCGIVHLSAICRLSGSCIYLHVHFVFTHSIIHFKRAHWGGFYSRVVVIVCVHRNNL